MLYTDSTALTHARTLRRELNDNDDEEEESSTYFLTDTKWDRSSNRG